ncbi:NADP-dependent oxidoreductase [Gracilaria domingensis]|nr:NADP-dependent oxidoreductase [Gracilaria domingensis]
MTHAHTSHNTSPKLPAFAIPSNAGLRRTAWAPRTGMTSSTCPRKCVAMVAETKAPTTDYKIRPVGDAGLVMTEVTLGTMTWGHQNTEQEAHDQLDCAFERGVVGIDGAEIYPVPPREETCADTERMIGSWIKKRGGSSFREKLVIFSKVAGGNIGGRTMSWIRGNDRKVDKKNIRTAVEGILKRLGTDYIDLLQIHWPDRYVPLFGAGAYDITKEVDAVPFEEQVAAMDELIKEGLIRNYGLSNETAWGVSQFHAVAQANGWAKPVSIQNSYSLIYRDFDGHLAEVCAERNTNVPLLAYSPLAGGALTGKYLEPPFPSDTRFALYPGYMERFRSSLAAEAIREYKRVADEAGLTLTQLSLAWCKSRWFVASTIIGATSIKQLEENLDAFSVDLDPAVIEAVEKVYMRYRDPSKTS